MSKESYSFIVWVFVLSAILIGSFYFFTHQPIEWTEEQLLQSNVFEQCRNECVEHPFGTSDCETECRRNKTKESE